mmetsp:Transcript_83089/g.220461  ORF Transcript_83089/g.220461 Transcript_83089/m.220461 type:complete len:216 (+) Transcript_83089:212-859(+)
MRIFASLSACSRSVCSAEAMRWSLNLSWLLASCDIRSSLCLFSSSLMRLGAPRLARAASLRAATVASYSSRLLTMWPLGPSSAAEPLDPRGGGDCLLLALSSEPLCGEARLLLALSSEALCGEACLLPATRLWLFAAAAAPELALELLLELEELPFAAFLAAFFAFLAAFFAFLAAFFSFFCCFFAPFSAFCSMRALMSGLAIIDSRAACSCLRI